jgi:hypothetical protein
MTIDDDNGKAIIARRESHLKKINLALKWLVIPIVVAFVLLAVPILGNVVALEFAKFIGCTVSANEPHACSLLGANIGGLLEGYLVGSFLAGAINPFLAGMALTIFISSTVGEVWLLAVFFLVSAKFYMLHRAGYSLRRLTTTVSIVAAIFVLALLIHHVLTMPMGHLLGARIH